MSFFFFPFFFFKAYIDKLEAEVKQRDNTIALLGLRVKKLEDENAKLQELLMKSSSVILDPSDVASSSFDLGFTTPEESCDSDNNDSDDHIQIENNTSSLLDTSRKRSHSPMNHELSNTSSYKRMNPGTILASLACLFFFHGGSLLNKFISNDENGSKSLVTVDGVNQATAASPLRQGRVLFSVDDPKFNDDDDKDDVSSNDFALVTSSVSPPPPNIKQSINLNDINLKDTNNGGKVGGHAHNKSYFFCPTKFTQSEGTWLQETYQTQNKSSEYPSGVNRPLNKRRLRAKTSLPNENLLKSKLNELSDSPSSTDQALVLSNTISSTSSNSRQMNKENHLDDTDRDSSSYQHLTLVVPSASFDGFALSSSPSLQSNWLEIDCRIYSAKFIDFK